MTVTCRSSRIYISLREMSSPVIRAHMHNCHEARAGSGFGGLIMTEDWQTVWKSFQTLLSAPGPAISGCSIVLNRVAQPDAHQQPPANTFLVTALHIPRNRWAQFVPGERSCYLVICYLSRDKFHLLESCLGDDAWQDSVVTKLPTANRHTPLRLSTCRYAYLM